MSKAEQKVNNIKTLKRLMGLVRPFGWLFLLASLLAVAKVPISLLKPYFVKQVIDVNIQNGDYPGVLTIIGLLFVLLVIEGILNYGFIQSSSLLGQNIIRDLRVNVFDFILRLRMTYFDRTPIGTSTTRTINDIETINSVFSEGLITIIADFLILIGVIGTMFYMSWELTLVCMIPVPLLILATYIFQEKVKHASTVVRNKIAEMNAFLQERITGMSMVQLFNAEDKEFEKFKKINQGFLTANLNTVTYYAIFFPVVEILSAISFALLAWYGGVKAVYGGDVTVGTFSAFPLLLAMLYRPVRMLADKFNVLQMGLVASDRVFRLLDTSKSIQDSGTTTLEQCEGNIVFNDVHFTYDQDNPNPSEDAMILKGISFQLSAGKTLAIVGSTGSGKSTIINVLSRFYETHSGNILIDNIPIKDITIESLRSNISVVLQDVFLFSGTILENITLRDSRITREAAIHAAQMIGAHEFISVLPGGYDYPIREKGANLSMGQRQLISFVRALVFNPAILVLDEATSSVDSETEGVIQHAIEKLIDKRTSIIIAHRLSTIRHADIIMVLKNGKIVEQGIHDDLLHIEDGHYRKLYEIQFTENIEH